MQAIAQNIAVGAALLFLATMMLRQIPFVGFFVRLAMRMLFLFSPIMLIVLLVGVVWFHGANFFSGPATDKAAVVTPGKTGAAPVRAPLPTERPR